jgi:PAS domain S-box-containing protein
MNTDPIRGPLKILIVEDSPTQAEQLRFILEQRNFNVTSARNGQEALAAMRAQKPTLVINDINMPEMDGYELCRSIRADGDLSAVPVILLTSLSDPEDVFRGLECGADNFITKPYDEGTLLARVHYLLANVHLRSHETPQINMEIFLAGQRHVITAGRAQILNLLLSTYEAAIQKNRELARAHNDLEKLNEQLEEKVAERTASLTIEIAEHKRAIEKNEEQAALLDKAQDAITVRDLEGRILFWNKGAEHIYGWTREEVMGLNIGSLIYEDEKRFQEINLLARSAGEWNGELQHLTKDRRSLTVEGRWMVVLDNAGTPKSVLAIDTDITERKKIEAQFMRAQRMESIGTLAGGIAHDLNNILSPIMLSIDILKTMVDHPQANQVLETIEMSSRRGADIVGQVLSFARGLEGQHIEIQPQHLLKDLELIIKDTFPKDITLQINIPENVWIILGDPTQLHQILLNLCVNARDAMPHGGTLTVSVENCMLDEQYVAMNIQAKVGPHVVITVTDSGTGIPPALLDKIFEPFFTTKEVGKGTGLGLSTVMALVKSHGGFVNVYSEPGKGTTFKVYIAARTSPSTSIRLTDEISLPRGNGETILVIDDEASILTITSQTLEAFGYRVLTATNGAEAIAIYAQHPNEIAVVLTDTMMPVMDGPATIHALMMMNPAVKIIVASGLNTNGSVAKASEAGIRHFLLKPYTATTLLKTLHAIMGKS